MAAVIVRSPSRIFFVVVASVALVVPFVGFAPTYYLKGWFGTPEIKPLVHVHAALFTLWPVLLLAQTLLIRARNVRLHITLGTAATVLAGLMVVTGFLVIMGKPRPTEYMRAFIFTPLLGLILFAGFFAVAIRFRRDPATHKRLMLLATLFIIPAGMTRLMRFVGLNPVSYEFVSYALVLLPLALYDMVQLRKLHPATLYGGAILVLRHPLHALVAHTAAWQAAAAWLTNS